LSLRGITTHIGGQEVFAAHGNAPSDSDRQGHHVGLVIDHRCGQRRTIARLKV